VAVALVLAVPSLASDPDNLQDICVADLNSGMRSSRFVEVLCFSPGLTEPVLPFRIQDV
jgi:hypothetical protein